MGDQKVVYKKEGDHAITCLASDLESETIMAGTHAHHIIHYKLNSLPEQLKLLTAHENHYETIVNTLDMMKTEDQSYFIAGHSNGLIKIFNCNTGAHLVDIQAHSRTVNAIVCHPSKPIFASVSDDTFVNLWYCK